MSRARARTERGTQSIERSSSMIWPLIRAIAYVSNFTSRARVVALDRADQAEQAVGDEVALVHVRGQAGAEPAGDVLDERRVREDQPVAQLLVAGAPVLEPQLLGLVGPAPRRREYGVLRRTPHWFSACRAEKRSARARRASRDRRRRDADDEPAGVVRPREGVAAAAAAASGEAARAHAAARVARAAAQRDRAAHRADA